MYRSSNTIAVLASFAVLGAAPVFAGGASVPNTSTATTSLSAVSVVPSGGGSGGSTTTPGGGGGSPSAGFSGMAGYSTSVPSSTGAALFNSPSGTPTTLNGVPAKAFPFSSGGNSYNVVVTQSGEVAIYPAN